MTGISSCTTSFRTTGDDAAALRPMMMAGSIHHGRSPGRIGSSGTDGELYGCMLGEISEQCAQSGPVLGRAERSRDARSRCRLVAPRMQVTAAPAVPPSGFLQNTLTRAPDPRNHGLR